MGGCELAVMFVVAPSCTLKNVEILTTFEASYFVAYEVLRGNLSSVCRLTEVFDGIQRYLAFMHRRIFTL